MNRSPDLRQLLLAYKLGELPTAERDEVDLRLIADAAFSDCLQEAEHDLLLDFHASRLSPADQRRVQRAFPAAQLSLSRAFATAMNTPAAPARVSRASQRPSYRAWGLAAAAMVLMAGGATFVRMHRSAPPSPSSPAAPPTAAQLPAPQSLSPASSLIKPQPAAAALLLLGATTTRDTGPTHLQLSSTVSVLRIQWVVPDDDSEQSFHLAVAQSGQVLATAPQRGRLGIIGGRRVAEFSVKAAPLVAHASQGDLLFSFFSDAAQPALAAEYAVRLKTDGQP